MQIRSTGPTTAKILIVGEAPDEYDVTRGEPYAGPAGQELNRMLHEAGILRSECFITMVSRSRPAKNDMAELIPLKKSDFTPDLVGWKDRMIKPQLFRDIQHLQKEIELLKPNVIIALGNAALWALTGKWGIRSWRGSLLTCDLIPDALIKVIPTYTPQSIFYNWSERGSVVLDLKRVAKEKHDSKITFPDYRFQIRPSYNTAIEYLAAAQKKVELSPLLLSVDIETRSGHIACIGFALNKSEAICIPFMCTENPEGYWTEWEESAIVWGIYKLLSHPNIRIIGQNFLYDAQYLYRWWLFEAKCHFDTMIGQHSMFSALPKGLDYLSAMYCKTHVYWKDESKDWDPAIGEEQLWTYNCKDAVITYEVYEEEIASIEKLGLKEVAGFQQALFSPVLETMNRGVKVDPKLRDTLAMELLNGISDRQTWINYVTGQPLNPKSPKQMQEFFYGDLKQKKIINRKTQSVTCNDDALQTIAEREPLLRPLINKISEIRSMQVFYSTFVTAPLDTDGRVRCSFNIAGTDTYRFSSSTNAFNSGMNLQNIPKGGEEESGLELPNIRKMFVPDIGYTFFDIDLDSADLRIVTWESDCKEMKAMFRAGKKPYVEVAKEFYHDPSITKHHKSYPAFKALCHGTNYLGKAPALAANTGLAIKEVERIQKWYFGKFPEIKKWQDRITAQIERQKYVENVFGYRFYFLDRIDNHALRAGVAWIPQSSVACLINRGYVNIYKNYKQVQILLQVHDSLGGQFPTYLKSWAVNKIVESCQIPLPYIDPLVIPVGIKTSNLSWGHCE